MAELQICLLGSFQVSWDFKPVTAAAWGDGRAARLLKLVLVRRPEPLAGEEAARLLGTPDLASLVARVNRVIGPAASLWVAGDGRIGLEATSACWIDLDAMLQHYQAGVNAALRGEMLASTLSFQEADGLYQGDLLEEEHEVWVTEPRRRLRAIYLEILDRLAEGHAVLARYQDAVGFCHKALAHDPLREATYQRMMVYYFYLGDMAGAEEAYLACRQALEEHGRTVSAETARLWEQLNRQQAQVSTGLSATAALPGMLAAPGTSPGEAPVAAPPLGKSPGPASHPGEANRSAS